MTVCGSHPKIPRSSGICQMWKVDLRHSKSPPVPHMPGKSLCKSRRGYLHWPDLVSGEIPWATQWGDQHMRGMPDDLHKTDPTQFVGMAILGNTSWWWALATGWELFCCMCHMTLCGFVWQHPFPANTLNHWHVTSYPTHLGGQSVSIGALSFVGLPEPQCVYP